MGWRTWIARVVAPAAALVMALCAVGASAAELRVLSAGAIEPGLRPVLAAFAQSSGHTVQLGFATAPQIRERALSGTATFDVVIAPPAVLDELEAASRIVGDRTQRVTIGRVGLGVVVRPGAQRPDIASVERFTRALTEADSLVFNRASTGLYVDSMLKRIGVDATGRSTRYPDGASVMEHVLHGKGREIGLGAITEILLAADKGVQFVGPLPAALQNYTTYNAAAARGPDGGDRADAARELLRQLAIPAARATFAAAGIDPLQ